ncbi:MAG TPA: DUF6677 family protein [Blastocatellia bacterium]|nr:DUF6677 family protein [Blastocatellia bacterium]
MQSRDDLTDNLTPRYRDRPAIIDEPTPVPSSRRTAALIAAWLVPGAGHLVLGRMGRGLLFLITIAGAFILGLVLQGRLYWPTAPDSPGFLPFDLISMLWFFAQIGAGLCYIIAYALGIGTHPNPSAGTFEYGNTFMFLAGLLNYLVIHDAYDIAAGRKR